MLDRFPAKDTISIIYVHHACNEARSELMRRGFKSLQDSIQNKNYLIELIVIDNGGSMEDSQFFLKEVDANRISHYIRNSNNIWYASARNQGMGIATGEYVCITDNDIEFQQGWLEECMNVLHKTEGQKYAVCPWIVDRTHTAQKFFRESVTIDGKVHLVNAMSGSSCWIMRKKDLDIVGRFSNRETGRKWLQKFAKKGYGMIILPEQRVENSGRKNTKYVGFKKRFKLERLDAGVLERRKYYINGEYRILSK